jgi:hypothetical protein
MSKIDLQQLRIEIQGLKRWHSLYKVLKEELSRIDHWKNAQRGNPTKAYKARCGYDR